MCPLLLPGRERIPSRAVLAFTDSMEGWGRSMLCRPEQHRQAGKHGQSWGRVCVKSQEWRESGKGPDVPWEGQGGKGTYRLLPVSHGNSMESKKHCPPALAFGAVLLCNVCEFRSLLSQPAFSGLLAMRLPVDAGSCPLAWLSPQEAGCAVLRVLGGLA